MTYKERIAITVPNPDANEKTIFNDAADGLLKTKDSSGVVETLATTEGIADTEPKVYVALLSQSGTDAPVATVLKNTLGGVPVWSYSSVGVYNAELSNAFTGDLIGFAYSGADDEATFTNFMVVKTGNSNLFISTEGIAVNYHINIRLKIEVYP